MFTLSKIQEFCSDRVEKFGAPYFAFAIFGIINYPLAYFIRVYVQQQPELESLTLRAIATFLCVGLLLKNYWPQKVQKYLPLYWYTTVTISLPVIMAYLLLKNNFSLEWLINNAVGLLITILILDWLTFLISMLIGTVVGYLIFILQYGFIEYNIDPQNFYLAIYLYSMIILFCLIFSRHKDRFNISVSEVLRKRVSEKTEELEKSLLVKEQFLNTVSHEIRSPIQVIYVLAEDLLGKWNQRSNEEISDTIAQISKNTKRLVDLVNNWIDVSGFSNMKQLKFEMKDNNLFSLIQDMLKNIKILAKEKKIHISFAKQHTSNIQDYKIICNKERIEQVFSNICTNAIKFSPERSEIVVDIYKDVLKQKDGTKIAGLCVSVKDQGRGILQKNLELIFDTFVQGRYIKDKPVNSGLGLGLALAKEIMNRHNGKIWAKNNKNSSGTTFYFFIPFDIDKSLLVPVPNEEIKDKKDFKHQLNILFLDDDEMCCMTGKLVLVDLGHKVKTFTNADEFFKCLKKDYSKVDILFLDIMMPVSGVEVIKKIKSDKNYKDIPIIAQSGVVSDSELAELFSFKDIGYISKPYNKSLVQAEIKRMMNVIRLQKD